MKYAALVYQAGLANVFELQSMTLDASTRQASRLLQSSFQQCEAFALGLAAAGVSVSTAACNQAGDITNADWSVHLDEHPFSESFRPVFHHAA